MGTIGAVGQMAAPTTAQGLSTLGTAAAGGLGQGYVQDPFTANLVAQTRNQFFNSTVPQLDAPFIQAGQTGFSTPAMNTLNTAGATLETGLAGLQENAYQQALTNQLQAAQQAVPLGLGVQSTGLSALTVPQQTQQTAFTNAYNEYLRQQAGPFAAATGMPNITGQTQQTLYGQSPFAEIASALTPAFMFSKMFPTFF